MSFRDFLYEKIKYKGNAAFQIMLTGSIIMLATALLCGIYFSIRLKQVSVTDDTKYRTYDKHYVLITDYTEQDFWDEIYEGALEEAQKSNIYIERFGEDLSVDCSKQDLLRMAIHSSVDGILVCGDSDPQTAILINEAVDDGIFVATIRQDVEESKRQCFIGINNYDLGLAYGKQILQVMNVDSSKPGKICILMDDTAPESTQSIISLAIQDAFKADPSAIAPEIQIQLIDTTDTFSAEETIRDIFMEEQNFPDVIACLNGTYTQCAYQAVVDYNHVGDIRIIGYYASDVILEAIQKSIVHSIISVDTDKVGQLCAQSIEEYEASGYTNSYVPVEIKVIGKEEAEELLHEEELSGE